MLDEMTRTAEAYEDSPARLDQDSAVTAQAVRSPGIGRRQLILGTLMFLLCTVGILGYEFHHLQTSDHAPRWRDLRWGYFALILLCLPVETLVSGLRTRTIARVLHRDLGLWICIKAEWVNVAMNLLTPAHSGGGPGQVYMMSREGVRAGTALTISLLGFLGTMVGLLGLGLYSLFVSGIGNAGPLFATSVWTLIAMGTAMAVAATRPELLRAVLAAAARLVWRIRRQPPRVRDWWPPDAPRTGAAVARLDRLTGRLADIIYVYSHDVRRFLQGGTGTVRSIGVICLLSLTFLFARCLLAYLCVRFLGIETASLRQIVEVQMAVIFLIFFAPTPGGAGVAEAASWSLMTAIVPAGFTPYYTLLWRFTTAYVGAMAGLACLARALVQDAQRVLGRQP
jgi:uncharacterized protein (TIRG00374 family)